MLTVFTCTRYVIFALSIICNAIIASVAVWNLSFVQTLDITYPLDTYLIFLGTFGLALVFVIVAVELVVQQSVTGRVWFECIWIGMLCIMNIVGASYLTANEPPLCNTRARILLGPHSCVSTQVLLGFTWSHTALLFWYFTLLTAFCLVRQTSEPGIWHSYIRDISNPVLFRRLTGNDTPAQPLPKFLPEKKFSVPIIAAPKPRRPPPPRDTITGLQTYYDVEPYTHDPHKHPPLPSSTIFPMTPGLYSQQVQSAIPAFPAAARTMYPPERRRTPSPPPLGDWPRADIISRPSPRKTTRKVTTLERVPEPDFIDDGSPSHRLVRPGGPRMRSESASRPRPPPLDLSKGKARGS